MTVPPLSLKALRILLLARFLAKLGLSRQSSCFKLEGSLGSFVSWLLLQLRIVSLAGSLGSVVSWLSLHQNIVKLAGSSGRVVSWLCSQ